MKNRRVLVDGNLCTDGGRRLKGGEVVKLLPHPAPAPPRIQDIRILYEDRDVVVVEKPAGVTSVRHREENSWPAKRRQIQPTLDEYLSQRLGPRNAPRKTRHTRPRQAVIRPVHRLDRETSGVMVFARNVPSERHLGSQFRAHSTERLYLAAAYGHVASATIESRLIRDRGDGRRGGTDEPGQGKHAVTHVRPIRQGESHTLVQCRLETGRTHQIRIHLAERGHPLCGDKVYRRTRQGEIIPDRSRAPRLALHAAMLGFHHPRTGEFLRFDTPLPADLEKWLPQVLG